MQTNNILSASLVDIVFDGRNKEYGAYYLRTTYPRRIKKALLITSSMALLIFGGAVLASSMKKTDPRFNMSDELTITSIEDQKPPEKLPEPEKQPEPDPVKTEKLTPPVITPDQDVETPPPSQDDLLDSKIGADKIDGKIDDGIVKPEVISDGTDKGIITPKNDVPDEPFTTVEIDAKFNGNWRAFLEKNLNPNTPSENGAPVGRYTVAVKFVVDVEGNVSNIEALTAHGYGMEAEALRVLRKAARWEPAIQNGIKVKAYRKQLITFEVLDSE
jgi:periplasmic protein TonB